ncbi:histidine phosphatase family protein [Mucilaginibacter sp. HMF5004]|uniref:histidine-type phosphatase n=1 Tax=Mucilaginibacter rivuli TaxID=2857527 RepID=UPI001C5DF249|nr:histidine-type phosphatase [Mucilaginibacter rivuli]MBW4888215.1 histidine phosphatase family protein [Mucilaginibacter rivuli]
MNRIAPFVLFIISVCSLSVQAQTCADKYWGTKTVYQPQQTKYTAIPKGYHPVYINYVGRHGSRHLTKDVAGTLAYTLLQKADSAKALTPEGYKLKAMVDLLQKIEKPLLKSISLRGAEELQSIGERMRLRNTGIFKPGYKVSVTITKEERTKQSAEAFLKGLQYPPDGNDARIDNDMLRFFSIAPAYLDFEKNGDWKVQMEKLTKVNKPNDFDSKIINRFFTKAFSSQLNSNTQYEFTDDIFGFSSITNSIQKEISNAGYTSSQLDFRSLITCDELRVLDLLASADDFLKKGSALNADGIQVRDAVPLLVSFINTTDAYIQKQNLVADLRFAHAETIAPFAALLGLSGASKPTTNILQYEKVWQASKVIPLSSNIQWVLFKDSKQNYLIKFFLNEKEVSIGGLSTPIFPYYKWNAVRAHYLNKLKKLHVELTGNMHEYLLNLR